MRKSGCREKNEHIPEEVTLAKISVKKFLETSCNTESTKEKSDVGS